MHDCFILARSAEGKNKSRSRCSHCRWWHHGAASAYWTRKRDSIKVAVLESHKRAWGASGRGGGFAVRTLFAYYNQAIAIYGRETARRLLRFNEESLRLLTLFVEERGNNCSYERCGSYLLAGTDDELSDLEESAQLMRDDGFEVEYFASDPLERGYLGGILNRCDIGVDTSRLVEMLIAESGVSVYEGEPVWKIERLDNGRIKLHTPGLEVSCDRLLLVTNAYASLLEPWFRDKIQPVRGQVLVTQPLKRRILDAMVSANYGWDYYRQLPDSRLLLGGRRFMYRTEETGYTDMVTEQLQSALGDYLQQYFPEVAAVPIEYRWSGVMAFTQDELPILGELVQEPVVGAGTAHPVPGAYYSIGCNGHGLGPSFALAKLLVEVALDGASTEIFATERLLSSQAQWSHAQQPGG